MLTYKYLPPERITYFEDELLRFTPPIALNDPFECLPVISVDEISHVWLAVLKDKEEKLHATRTTRIERRLFRKKKKKQLAAIQHDPRWFIDWFFANAEREINSKIGIFSLSKRWDSSLMWAHYAQAHQGFCVGFHREHAFFQNREVGIRDVVYAEERIRVPVERGKKIDFQVMFQKSGDWAYEREERILSLLASADKTLPTTSFPIHLFKVPHEAVREVVLGARVSADAKRDIATHCKRMGVPLFDCLPSSKRYDMERVSSTQSAP